MSTKPVYKPMHEGWGILSGKLATFEQMAIIDHAGLSDTEALEELTKVWKDTYSLEQISLSKQIVHNQHVYSEVDHLRLFDRTFEEIASNNESLKTDE